MAYRVVNLVVGKILSADVQTEAMELPGHLRLQLEVGRIATLVVQFAATVQLTRHVELPQFERRLIREREQAFVARSEGLLSQTAVVGALHVVKTEGGCGCHAAEQRVCSINLKGVTIALAVEILEAKRLLSTRAIEVHYPRIDEAGVVILCVQLQISAEERYVEAQRSARVD